jgi:CheY-like chemotaxis protein
MRRVNSHAEALVTDSGQGMEPGFLAHAFERFRQSESGQTQKTKGLGLGLSIAKNIVEMHGGAIRAMSEGVGKGSTFVVELPVTAVHGDRGQAERVHPRAAVSAAPFEVRGITLAGVKVLVVDDEADAREVVRRVLTASGAEVATAASAAEALAVVGEFAPGVLVSDVGLHGEDGYELIRKVRMLGGDAGRVPAVALTAFARLEDRTRAMLSGFQMHLAKPVDARELVVTVATLASR